MNTKTNHKQSTKNIKPAVAPIHTTVSRLDQIIKLAQEVRAKIEKADLDGDPLVDEMIYNVQEPMKYAHRIIVSDGTI